MRIEAEAGLSLDLRIYGGEAAMGQQAHIVVARWKGYPIRLACHYQIEHGNAMGLGFLPPFRLI